MNEKIYYSAEDIAKMLGVSMVQVFENEWKKYKKQFYSELFLLCSGYIRCKTFYDWRKRYERQRIDSKSTQRK